MNKFSVIQKQIARAEYSKSSDDGKGDGKSEPVSSKYRQTFEPVR